MPGCVANAWKPPLSLPAACRRRTRHGVGVDLDFAELYVSSGAVATARHQVHEPDFIDLAQIGIRRPDFVIWICCELAHIYRDHTLRIEFDPADLGQGELVET